MKFQKYWTEDELSKGLQSNKLIAASLRINSRNYEEAYVAHPDGFSDIFINGMEERNRALNGDIVYVEIYPKEKWKISVDDLDEKVDDLLNVLNDLDISQQDDSLINSTISSNNKQLTNDGKFSINLNGIGDDSKILNKKKNKVSNKKQEIKKDLKKNTPNKFVAINELLTTTDDKVAKSPTCKHIRQLFFAQDHENTEESLPKLGNAETKKITKHIAESIPLRLAIRTGHIVGIAEKKHSRLTAGSIKPMSDGKLQSALFSPMDNKVPRIFIPGGGCPKDFFKRPEDFKKTLFVAKIISWDENAMFPRGELVKSLGLAGEIEPETEGILLEHGVDDSPFPPEVLSCLPSTTNEWKINAEERSKRRDFTKTCLFTIDPLTARDLDDAVSCDILPDGNYEIGVHIADVSHFVKPDTALDDIARDRATSVYLVQKVIPMLPHILCEKLCSLNPNEDRLAFSVVWHITREGLIVDEWFGKSVIRSCVKLAYQHAQGFIEQMERKWTEDELPPISPGFSVEDIRSRVLSLHSIASLFRKQRFENGALRLDQVKLQFALDKDTQMPCGWSVYEQQFSHQLIEEFMLLANMAVARKISAVFPNISVLRRHESPQGRQIEELEILCKQLSIQLDTTSSRSIQQSIKMLFSDDSEESMMYAAVVMNLCLKMMQLAKYFCTGTIEDETEWRHYALCVPLYTHFTSPIRRYADIMVHRLLAAALNIESLPNFDPPVIQVICNHLNDKKVNAKLANDMSINLFFGVFVRECGPLKEKGTVMAVHDKAFDVLLFRLGFTKRVYCDQLDLDSYDFEKFKKKGKLRLHWKAMDDLEATVQEINIFTNVSCYLSTIGDLYSWKLTILHPLY